MSKEKISTLEKDKKEVTFYYEVIGIVFILMSIISITRLGKAGITLALIFKLLFGDWYFLFIFYLLYLGVKLLLSHTPIKFKSMRFVGVVLISICLLILSHISFFKFISKYTSSTFKTTLSFYIDAFKYQNFDDLSGGGIIGATFFHFFYLLFSTVGTTFIAIMILYVGICFIFQKTVFEFTNKIFSFIKKIFKQGIKIKNIFKYEIKQYPNKNYHIKINPKWFKTINITNGDEINKNYEEMVFLESKKAINSYHFFYEDLTKVSTNHVFLIVIKTYHLINIESFHKYLKSNIQYPFLLRKNPNQIYLEFNAKNPKGYSFTKSLTNNSCVIGIDPFNEIIEYDLGKDYLLFGYNYYDFLLALEYLIINKYDKKIQIMIVDENFDNYPMYKRALKDLPAIFDDANQRLQKINDFKFSTYKEYNQNNPTMTMSERILIINKFEIINNSLDFRDLFFKFLTISKVVGYHVLVFSSSEIDLSKLEEQLFDIKIITKNNFQATVNYVNPILLDAITDIEGVYIDHNEELRLALTRINTEEIKILNDKLKEKKGLLNNLRN